jgi:hypothetical protein
MAQKKHQVSNSYLIDSDGNKHKCLVIEVDYDIKGNSLRTLNRVYAAGRFVHESISKMSYSPNGEPTEEILRWQGKGGYKTKEKFIYSYSEGLSKVKYNSCENIYYYDARHNLIKVENICSNQLSSVTIYQYDTLSRQIRKEFKSLPDSTRYQITNTKYDDILKMKIVETEERFDDSTKSSTCITYFNDYNQPFRSEDQATKEYSLFFYNAQGDLIRRDVYNSDNKLKMIIKTKIQYWK